ncbi:MAG: glycosyltransferase family 2 protein [Cyanobacteria bacterium P01_E01_bin.45]
MTTAHRPDPQASIYFLTVNYYSAQLVCRLLESIAAAADYPYHLVIVNNSMCERQSASLPTGNIPQAGNIPRTGGNVPCTGNVTVLDSPDNVGFGRGCNIGLDWIYNRDASALVWLINPDAQLSDPISLVDVHAFMRKQHAIAILGTAIVTDTGEQWFCRGWFNAAKGSIFSGAMCSDLIEQTGSEKTGSEQAGNWPVPESDLVYTCDWVSGCSMLIDLTRFDCCPHFDPAFFLYYEDFDFCQRYQAQGYSVATTHRFSVVHTPSSVTNRNVFNKINHSTFSYLLVLDRYTTPPVRLWRFLRLVCMAIVLLPVRPTAAFGKLYGIARYLSKRA